MIRLHDSMSGTVRDFIPNDPKRVLMYTCGITPYQAPHLGNARSAIAFDILFRLLRHTYGAESVLYARNITDIDDKIMARATEANISIEELTEKTIQEYNHSMNDLNALPPIFAPRVTQTIPEIIQMISDLIAKEHAYVSQDHVLFSVSSNPKHGELSGNKQEMLESGHRLTDVADYKRDQSDFVLWKPSDSTQPGWDSPWGRGRPGWHIECSAMIKSNLGTTIDIHCGGNDLIFPHHDCEISQSECANDRKLANYWLHNGLLTINGKKMSKSEGFFITVPDLLEQVPGEVVRYILINAHYRQPLDWTISKLKESRSALDRLYRALENVWSEPDLNDAELEVSLYLQNDLNTPEAIASLHEIASKIFQGQNNRPYLKHQLLKGGQLLGIFSKTPSEWFQNSENIDQIERLIARRDEARKEKRWDDADAYRQALLDIGVIVEDLPGGTTWKMK